jgi:hypothetical protein
MARDDTKAELDEVWLDKALGRRASMAEIDEFVERVAILVCDAGIDEARARTMALEMIK